MTSEKCVDQQSPLWDKVRRILSSGLSANEKLLLISLADYAGQGGKAFPSQHRLAADMSLKERQVRNIIGGLKVKEVLNTKKQQRSSLYQIRWENLTTRPEADCQSEESQIGNEVPVTIQGTDPPIAPDRQWIASKTGNGVPTNREGTENTKKAGIEETKKPVTDQTAVQAREREIKRWCAQLKPDDFSDLSKGIDPFKRAVKIGFLRQFEDRVWFFTLWRNSWRKFRNGTTDNPARLFVGNLRIALGGGVRKGTQEDEDEAIEFLQRLDRGPGRRRLREEWEPEVEPKPLSSLVSEIMRGFQAV